MTGSRDQVVVSAAQLKLEALRRYAQVMEEEQVQKEARLQQLQTQLGDLQRQKECALNRTRHITADSLSVMNDLRSVEELEMLDGMLNEKHTQLLLRQVRQDALLQQIASIEGVLDIAPVVESRPGQGLTLDELGDSSVARWSSCCEHLQCHIDGLQRYCLLHTSHVVNHPVSVFRQSLRKLFRIVRSREEELVIQLECVDVKEQERRSLDIMLRSIEIDHQRDLENLERGNHDMLQSMTRAAAQEGTELRKELQEAAQTCRDLIANLQDQGFLQAGVERSLISPSLVNVVEEAATVLGDRRDVSLCSTANGSCASADLTPLNSASILSCSRLNKKNSSLSPAATDADVMMVSLSHEMDPAPTAVDDEVLELQRQVAAAERDVHRLQQCYESLEEEASRALCKYEADLKSLEEKRRAAKEVVEVLKQENSDWQALQQQMSLLMP